MHHLPGLELTSCLFLIYCMCVVPVQLSFWKVRSRARARACASARAVPESPAAPERARASARSAQTHCTGVSVRARARVARRRVCASACAVHSGTAVRPCRTSQGRAVRRAREMRNSRSRRSACRLCEFGPSARFRTRFGSVDDNIKLEFQLLLVSVSFHSPAVCARVWPERPCRTS